MKDALHTSQPKNDRIALTNLFITPLILLVQRIFAPKLRHLAWLSLALAVGVLASGPKAVKADEILQPFLDIVSSIFVLPPGMAAKFAADPVLQYYQLERQSKARQPNLSQVPPRPVLSPDAATQKEKQALQRQHDQLWQGQSRQGSQNQGSQNQGSQNQGSQNQGNQNQGNQNQATPLPHQAGSYAQPYSPPPATRPPPKPHEWVPNLVGKKPTEATESADLNVARSSPFGMRTINPSPLDLNNLNFINTPFNSQDAMRTGYLPTEAPTPPTAATTGQNAADSGLPPLSQRVERQVDDADFLASEPPPAAQIAPPNAAASPDKKARQAGKPVADKAVAGKPVAGKPVADKAVAGKPVAGK
ncbi:MAG: hypothetical protein QM537_08245, partial [Candidatus Symbiobacter sp.]|nr:hypothetical protein [Candidatus Symbiobacter sp.]